MKKLFMIIGIAAILFLPPYISFLFERNKDKTTLIEFEFGMLMLFIFVAGGILIGD